MILKASVYVTEGLGNSYKARITLPLSMRPADAQHFFQQRKRPQPLQLDCTLAKGTHDVRAEIYGEQLDLDEESSRLLERFILAASKNIYVRTLDLVEAHQGCRKCAITEGDSGILIEQHFPGRAEIHVEELPDYLVKLSESVQYRNQA